MHRSASIWDQAIIQTWYIADQQTELTSGEEVLIHMGSASDVHGSLPGVISTTVSAQQYGPNSPGLIISCLISMQMPAFHPAINIRLGQIIMPGQSYDTARLVFIKTSILGAAGRINRTGKRCGVDAFRDIGVMVTEQKISGMAYTPVTAPGGLLRREFAYYRPETWRRALWNQVDYERNSGT